MIIYKITNQANGKVYIGKDFYGNRRIRFHKNQLAANKHPNKHLQNAWNKYGESAFTFETIDKLTRTLSEDDLSLLEIKRISEYDSTNPRKGYNKTFGGEGCTASEETRKKMKQKAVGRQFSEKTKSRLSKSIKQKWQAGAYENRKSNAYALQTDEYRNKLSSVMRPTGWRDITVVSPDNIVYENISNLKQFCREHNLNYHAFRNMLVLPSRIDKNPRTYHNWKIFK